jgi:hypothetical protein
MRADAKAAGFGLAASIEPVKTEADVSNFGSGLTSIAWLILKITLIGGAVFLAFMYLSNRLGRAS